MARKSPYQARIEKVLASKTFALNTVGLVDVMRGIEEGGVWGGDIWQLTCDDHGRPKVRYGHASCQLCGKPHIKWQFFINQRNGSEMTALYSHFLHFLSVAHSVDNCVIA